MSTTRLTLSTKAPLKSFFTMVELIAVISITAILLTITVNIMKTDSTKANAQVVGSNFSYAQAKAMSNNTPVIVEFSDKDSDGNIDTITTYQGVDANPIVKTAPEEIINQVKLVKGSLPMDDTGSSQIADGDQFFISKTGEPVKSDTTSEVNGFEIYIKDNKSTSTAKSTMMPVKMKAFTGKVTYY